MNTKTFQKNHRAPVLTILAISLIAIAAIILSQSSPSKNRNSWSFAVIGHPRANENFASNPIFIEALKEAENLGAELLFLNGDMVLGGLESLAGIQKEWSVFDKDLKNFSGEIYHAPGNHDLSTTQMTSYYRENHPLSGSFLHKGVQFIIFNSVFPTEERGGNINEEEIAFIRRELEKYGDSIPFIFLMHHPLWANNLYPAHKKALDAVVNLANFSKNNWWDNVHPLFAKRRGFIISGDAGTKNIPYTYFEKDRVTYILSGISASSLKDNVFLHLTVAGGDITITPLATNHNLITYALKYFKQATLNPEYEINKLNEILSD
ncbi:MAG: metallophosphoesterase [Candidatus Liptonbacteria bacterium]|nr:metallophosphoesterase [Candidatus Liptonbacteria bacterium]